MKNIKTFQEHTDAKKNMMEYIHLAFKNIFVDELNDMDICYDDKIIGQMMDDGIHINGKVYDYDKLAVDCLSKYEKPELSYDKYIAGDFRIVTAEDVVDVIKDIFTKQGKYLHLKKKGSMYELGDRSKLYVGEGWITLNKKLTDLKYFSAIGYDIDEIDYSGVLYVIHQFLTDEGLKAPNGISVWETIWSQGNEI